NGKEPTLKRVPLPAAPLRSPAGVKLPASLGYALVASPEGDRVYFPRHALGALGADAWFGTGTVDVLLTDDDSTLAPARSAAPTARFVDAVAKEMKDDRWVGGAIPVIETRLSLNAPRAIAYRKKTKTI